MTEVGNGIDTGPYTGPSAAASANGAPETKHSGLDSIPITKDHDKRLTDKKRLLELKNEILQKQKDLTELELLAKEISVNNIPSDELPSLRSGTSTSFSIGTIRQPAASSVSASNTSSKVISNLHNQIDMLTQSLQETQAKLKGEIQTKKAVNRKLEQVEEETSFTKNQLASLNKVMERREKALEAYEKMEIDYNILKEKIGTVQAIEERNGWLEMNYKTLESELIAYKNQQHAKMDELQQKFTRFMSQEIDHSKEFKASLLDNVEGLVLTIQELKTRVETHDTTMESVVKKCDEQLEDIRSTLKNIKKLNC
ncbi:hypothetical protein NADFUDRAFT_52288 [Nadsonia fulvescens var. elongata DSM 6958]|uniref:SWI5-dependent HO expression protein 3 n=1 Tax=Nadsonia fulvescens var. elongata DSM 6958 TaxID=857566 RepID=A0A1E3PGX4_9ASCO|nr:hypothetical protein NADFUDRAFT_52288 [Nadsonia fulvescens var. elongata DSM 6958]